MVRTLPAVTLACALIGGAALGAAGMLAFGPQRQTTETWFYLSEVGERLSFGMKPDGSFQFGSAYQRQAEAQRLARALRQLRTQELEPTCRDAAYRPPPHGVRRIDPGTAMPPPQITEQAL